MNTRSNRRQFLQAGATALGAFALGSPISKAFAATCGLTPPQTSGPFYPGEKEFDQNTDLTQIPGRPRAAGRVVYVRGKVVDQDCNPLAGANVELWQACVTGKYNAPNDPNPAEIDPNFRYWAETFTNAKGEYIFKTIIPGAYPADVDWDRPPHIHFKVSRIGFLELTTQMYFKGDPLNDKDLILRRLSAAERDNVIVDFQVSPVGFEPGTLIGNFDITLRSVR